MKTGTKMTYTSLAEDESIHDKFERALVAVEKELGKSHPLHIGETEITAGPAFEVHSPFDTTILVGKFPAASPPLIRSAIMAAKNEVSSWEERGWKERATILKKAAKILEKDLFNLAALITYETGKIRAESIAEVSEAVDMIQVHVAVMGKNKGFITPMASDSPVTASTSVMRPYGTWAVISPFNFPLSLATGMASAALLCGNTVILKPTSEAPYSCLKLYEALVKAGVPANAVHYLTGPGGPFGEIITAHPDIDGIAFTGSRDVGILLQRRFSERQPYQKPLVAEMGSKNPVIVTANADIDKAVDGVVASSFGFCGQKCSASSRVFVHPAVFDHFLTALVRKTEKLVIGDPRKRDTFIGPVIDAKAASRFSEIVIRIRRDGGKIICGGGMAAAANGNGYFVQPTIVTGLSVSHPLVRAELFAPVVFILSCPSLEQALREANDTDFGLTAGIFSEDPGEVDYFFDIIQSGVVYANRRTGATTGAWPGMQPFGGWKASGSTGKGIGGSWYLLSYMREQVRTRVG